MAFLVKDLMFTFLRHSEENDKDGGLEALCGGDSCGGTAGNGCSLITNNNTGCTYCTGCSNCSACTCTQCTGCSGCTFSFSGDSEGRADYELQALLEQLAMYAADGPHAPT